MKSQTSTPEGQTMTQPTPATAPSPQRTAPPTLPFLPAYYFFRLDNFRITNTRSWDEDTDHVTFALKVGDNVYGPQTIHTGNVDNGTHQIGLQFGPVLVDSASESVVFNYLIVNSGHESTSDIEKQMGSAALSMLGNVFSLGTPWTAIIAVVWNILFGIFDANCDGAVASDQINLNGGTLWARTHGAGVRAQTNYYPGTDSPVGCGDNSQYYVTWSIVGGGIAIRPIHTNVVHEVK